MCVEIDIYIYLFPIDLPPEVATGFFLESSVTK